MSYGLVGGRGVNEILFLEHHALGHAHSGMTMLESLLAISMLSVFTGVVAMVMQFTLRFFDEAESVVQNAQRSRGVNRSSAASYRNGFVGGSFGSAWDQPEGHCLPASSKPFKLALKSLLKLGIRGFYGKR